MVDLTKRHILKVLLGGGAVAAGLYGLVVLQQRTRLGQLGVSAPRVQDGGNAKDGLNRSAQAPLLPVSDIDGWHA